MDILEFIEKHYPIKHKLEILKADPFKRIANADDLPYDAIGPDEYGNITKLVEVEDDRYISVFDLLSYERDELETSKDTALLNVYDIYMEQIDLKDVNIMDIMASAKRHKEKLDRDKEKLDVLRV